MPQLKIELKLHTCSIITELVRTSLYIYLILKVGWRDPLVLSMAVLSNKLLIIDMWIIPILIPHWNGNQTSTVLLSYHNTICRETEYKANIVVFFPIKYIFTVVSSYSESEFTCVLGNMLLSSCKAEEKFLTRMTASASTSSS